MSILVNKATKVITQGDDRRDRVIPHPGGAVMSNFSSPVIPATAGTQSRTRDAVTKRRQVFCSVWAPAFAGVTVLFGLEG